MDPRILTGGAPLVRAPAHVRLGRSLRRVAAPPGATSLSPRGAQMTVGQEAIVLSPYWDSARPPVLSIYVGHTKAAGSPDPADLWHRLGTIGQGIAQFETDAPRYEAGVRRAFTRPLTQAQFDAAFDFNYNSGAIEVANWVKLFNAGRDADAERSFIANWREPSGRRDVERQLFFHGKYVGDGTALLVPANARGQLNWHAASRIDISGYFPANGRRAA